MKTYLAVSGLCILATSFGATDPGALRFGGERIGVPPLSLRDSMNPPDAARSLGFGARIPSLLGGDERPRAPLPTPRVIPDQMRLAPKNTPRVLRDSGMPVLIPRTDVDYAMKVIPPDPSVDYKLRIKDPGPKPEAEKSEPKK